MAAPVPRKHVLRRRFALALVMLVGVVVVVWLGRSPAQVLDGRSSSTSYSNHLKVDDGTEDPAVAMLADLPEELSARSPFHTSVVSRKVPQATMVERVQRRRSHYLTVVVMSYPKSSRFHLLEQIIRKCSDWTFVWEIILIWNGDVTQLPARIRQVQNELPSKSNASSASGSRGEHDLDQLEAQRKVQQRPFFTVIPQEMNRVDNRWRIASHVDTDAILNMDDDINLYETGAKCMMDVWRAAPSSLVAIDVRSHFMRTKDNLFGKYGYVARDRSAGYKQYSIALPRALLTHRDYFVAYDKAWQTQSDMGIKKIVDELLCDDIAFNFVAANTSLQFNEQLEGGHVVYVKAKYAAYPESHSADAMTKKDGMKAMRQRCVNVLADSVGKGEVILRHRPWHVLCEVDG